MKDIDCRYDVEGLAAELELELAEIAELYASYFSEMSEEVANMKDLLGKSDWNMLERVVHNIKGVSANLNVSDVFAEARSFDNRLKQDEFADTHLHIDNIERLLACAASDIRKFLKGRDLVI